jgi:type VI secretion system protein ImpE
MKGTELYEAGKLQEAVAAMIEEVKSHPTDTARRGFLAELLGFTGDLERVDKHLDMLGSQDPQVMMSLAMWRQLVRAEQWRQQFFSEGRLPEFLDLPTDCVKLHLEASILIREKKGAEALALLAKAEEIRPKVGGVCDGQKFDDFRDLDDLTSPVLEVLTSNGKYYWIPMERIESIEFRAPKRPRDLMWRGVRLSVASGPDGEVFIPCLYPGTSAVGEDRTRLGRLTDWVGGNGEPVRGVGQRTFLIGNEDKSVMQLQKVEFNIA